MRILTYVLIAIFGSLAVATDGSCATKIKKNITCPPIIASRMDGTYRRVVGRSSQAYTCFRNELDAKRSGFKSSRTIQAENLTGWYRLRLSTTKNTCDANPTSSGPVLFVQLKETDSGVFGQFCPSIGDYSGIRQAGRVIFSGIQQLTQDPAESMCDDGHVQRHQYVEFSKVIENSFTYSVTYKQVESCTSLTSGTKTCSREYTGIAFHETHKIWPAVPENINELPNGCTVALSRCSECHAELNNIHFP